MTRFLLVAATLALALGPAAAQTCTTSWAVAVSGAWSVDANWTDGAPGGADTACITAEGTYTVTLDRDQALEGLVLGGASGLQTLQLGRTLTSLGEGAVGPNGRLEVLDSANCGSCDGLPLVVGTLTVEGTITHTTLTGLLSGGGTLDIAPGGLLLVDTGVNSVSIGSASGTAVSTLRVRGRAEFSPGSGSPRNTSVRGRVEVVGGTLDVAGGRVDVGGEGLLRDATLEVAESATLWFLGHGFTSSTYVLEGTVGGTPQGLLQFSTSTVRAGAAGVTLAVGGTGLLGYGPSGTGVFTFDSAGGPFVNTGLLRVIANGATLRAATIENRGTLRVDQTSLTLADGAGIETVAGGVLELVDGGGIRGGPDGGTVSGPGRILARLDDSSSGFPSITVPVDLDGATVEVATNGLQLSGGALRDVVFIVPAGSELLLTSANGGGVGGVFATGGTLSGDIGGAVQLSSAEFASDAAGTTLALGGNGFSLRAGSGGYALLTGGPFVNRERVNTTFNGGEVRGTTLRNEGLLQIGTPSLGISETGSVINVDGATVELTNSGGFSPRGGDGGTFVNEGLLVKDGPGRSSFARTLRGQPGSELRVLSGELTFNGEPAANYGAGVLLTVADESAGASIQTLGEPMQGTLSPGVPGDPIVTMTHNGSLQFDADAGDARLVLDVDGASADQIRTLNRVTLGGTLVVRLADGYTPAPGDEWTIINDLRNNVPLGAFNAVEVEGDAGGLAFVVEANAGSVVLRAAAGVAVSAPVAEVTEGEPASFVLRHPAQDTPFTIAYEVEGSATPYEDYTLTASRGTVRAVAGATQTVVSFFARRDADTTEGPEDVTFRVIPGGDASPVPGADEADVVILDGPSSEALALETVVPARGENAGTVTPTILGQALGADATVRLEGGATITAGLVEAASSGGVSAEFDLAGAPVGTYDVVVEQGGQSATLPGAFEVVEAQRVAQIWADVTGTPSPRVGRWSTYTVHLGNDTDADVHDVGLILRVTNGAEIEVMEGIRDLDDAPAADQEIVATDFEGSQVIPLWFRKLPARSQGSFRVRLKTASPLGIGDDFGVAYELYPPDNANPFTWSGDFEDAVPFNYGLIWGTLGAYVDAYPPSGTGRLGRLTAATAPLADARRTPPRCPPERDGDPPPLIQDESVEDLIRQYDQGNRFNRYHGGNVAPSTSTAVSEYAGFSLSNLLSNATRSAGYAGAAGVVGVVAGLWSARSYAKKAESIVCDRQRDGSLPPGGCEPPGPPGGPGGPTGGGACGTIGGSFDPNDKYGPAGVGAERFYNPGIVTTPYEIAFENIDTATFPAQEVVIVDTLDTAAFDLSTFSLGPIRWGTDRTVTPPPGAQTFETEVDLAPELPATLRITAHLDPTTGRAVWHFVTLDPATGDLPEDGTIGFLPPNLTSPEGEGLVTFSVAAREGLASGTTVANGAEIVFDVNAPIVTPIWSNVVDTEAPTSRVDPLDETATSPFPITISGTDAGSGVVLYGLFASKDGGPFELVGVSSEPTFEFEGEVGSTYGFYSVAADAVENVEPLKTEAETSTAVVVDGAAGPAGPTALTVGAARPNPTRGEALVRVGVPTAGAVRVAVFDALGREVAVLLDGERPAGWYDVPWDGSAAAAGVYMVRAVADGNVATRTLTVVR